MRAVCIAVLVAGCASSAADRPPVEVRAVSESSGMRVLFRCLEPVRTKRLAVVEAAGGVLREITHSPDRSCVSVLWLEPSGELRCRFPNGGVGVADASRQLDAHDVDYTFAKREWGNVTARVPRGCPLKPIVILRVFVGPQHLPGVLVMPSGESVELTDPVSVHVLALPVDRGNRLRAGDLALELRAQGDRTVTFLVGVDPDGTPTATSGFVQNW